MNNLIRENLKIIVNLRDETCDLLGHFNGNYNIENFGFRNGGKAIEDDIKIAELKYYELVVGPMNEKVDTVDGIAQFHLTSRGKDIAELLFWIENGEEKAESLKSGLNQAMDKQLFDLY